MQDITSSTTNDNHSYRWRKKQNKMADSQLTTTSPSIAVLVISAHMELGHTKPFLTSDRNSTDCNQRAISSFFPLIFSQINDKFT